MIDFAKYKRLDIPEGRVKSITRKSDGLLLWKAGYVNQIPLSTEADGVTIYNGGLGYKNGYRVRSGGAELAFTSACCTGYIPVTGLSVIRVSGYDKGFKDGGVQSAVNVYDANFSNLGQISGNTNPGYGIFVSNDLKDYAGTSVVQETNCWKWTVPPNEYGIAYIRVSAHTTEGSRLIVTVDEEIE